MAEVSPECPIFKIYNTLTKQKKVFRMKQPNKVGMYVCGVPAYDFSHIRHARAYVAFDVLYRPAKPGEPSWDSPCGPGRPGWHIECPAMSAHYLTPSFDIHGGGMDLIFPHHENELAQSCAACPETLISYWVHNGFVTINDKKMSKSTGNFFTIRKVTKLYHPLALRYFLLSMHYNSPVNYSLSQIEFASDAVFRICQTLQECRDALSLFQDENLGEKANSNSKKPSKVAGSEDPADTLKKGFESKMSDDLHTPEVLKGLLPNALTTINNHLNDL